MSFSSRIERSLPVNIIFCFLAGGPEEKGVDGTAVNGVGGWGIVAEAGVRPFT